MKKRFAPLGCLLLFAVPVIAQTNADVNAGLQFNFAPPGARSLGLGGAFSGLADDATAAYANPAGLVKLSKPEVSAEFRDWGYTTTFPSGGSYPGSAGNPRKFASTDSSASDLSFVSFVYPLSNWSFAAFRHQVSSFESRLDAEGIDLNDNGTPDTVDRAARLSLDLVGTGASASYRLNDSFSAGLSLIRYEYDHSYFSMDPANNRQVAAGSDEAIGGSLGMLWALDRWSVGAVYRLAPELDGTSQFLCGRNGDVNRAQICNRNAGAADDIPENEPVPELSGATQFDVPDTFSLGLGFQPNSRLTLSFEYARVGYSEISDNLRNVLTDGAAGDFSIEDANELHLGGELRLPLASERSLFLRAGGWLDPDHSLRYTGTNPRFQARFGTDDDRDDEIHYAVGLGFAYAQSFQIDAAADFSDLVDTASLSAVYRF